MHKVKTHNTSIGSRHPSHIHTHRHMWLWRTSGIHFVVSGKHGLFDGLPVIVTCGGAVVRSPHSESCRLCTPLRLYGVDDTLPRFAQPLARLPAHLLEEFVADVVPSNPRLGGLFIRDGEIWSLLSGLRRRGNPVFVPAFLGSVSILKLSRVTPTCRGLGFYQILQILLVEVGHLLVLNEDLLGLKLSLTQQTGQLVPVCQFALVQYPRILLCPALFIIAVATVRSHQSRLTTARRCGTTWGVSSNCGWWHKLLVL
mmetsp:Transcript_1975/g.3483  ORF Transcript_1975/g.3483 Transcript_1975/m.3483 type:complete len:256 (+) Transcript_1975:249-1016(+)